ncbi:MAG: ATP-binding protein [Beijerinckiaceae bacterium]|nr:ATP-binding protein [Beijerinckiaceae bacterium]MCI0735887.1 ATP-binding protein [Beijerinckiaceae bacterium]
MEFLAALPSGVASGMPVIAMGGRHADHPSTVVLASRDLLFLCGAKNLDGLSLCLAGGDKAGPERLLEFTSKFNVDAPPSVERLQARIGRTARTIAFLGRRVSVEDAPPLFIGVVLDLLDWDEQAPTLEKDTGRQARSTAAGHNQGSRNQGPRRTVLRHSRPGAGSRNETLELELRRQKADFRELSAILDTAMDGVAVLDSQGLIQTLNRSGEALFSYDQHEIAGKPFTCLLAPECRPLAQDYFEGLRSHGASSLFNRGREVTGLARHGGMLPVFMTLARIGTSGAGKQGEARFCALLRDLTHWKNVERELREARKDAERANALKSDFVARVSHEIRTPLNAILGFAEVIMDERFGPIGNERYKDYLGDIHASGTLVMSLVNDLLDLSKIEAGKMDFEFISIDVNRIVSECISIMQPQACREQVDLRLSLSPALPSILADERSLRQIVLNLLSNAVKFNRPGGQVILSTLLADSGSAVIRIRDTGVGMREGDLGLAFEPFRRLSTERPARGTGLGLPLTKALVEANHASMTVKSKEHEGTLVEVVFPPARILAE